MKLITIEKVVPGQMLPHTWLCFVLYSWKKVKCHIAFSFYIPWIFTGPYYDPYHNLQRYGWRIPRVLFEVGFSKPLFRRFFWYEAI